MAAVEVMVPDAIASETPMANDTTATVASSGRAPSARVILRHSAPNHQKIAIVPIAPITCCASIAPAWSRK